MPRNYRYLVLRPIENENAGHEIPSGEFARFPLPRRRWIEHTTWIAQHPLDPQFLLDHQCVSGLPSGEILVVPLDEDRSARLLEVHATKPKDGGTDGGE